MRILWLESPGLTFMLSEHNYSWWTFGPYEYHTADRAEDALDSLTDYYLRHPNKWREQALDNAA